MQLRKKIVFILCIFTFHVCSSQAPAFITDSLDTYVMKGLKDWNVPGLSIVVVKDGQIAVMKGYGVTNINSRQPVDENTLFMIASNTKLFTGTALALLDYRKKLSLNDKITKYFPAYKLYDKTSTDLVTIRDMLCHRIGTKTFQGDFTFWNSTLSRSEIMNKMRYLKPVGHFRQDYGYCNSCFLTAGEVIQTVTGIQWENFISDSIITPLGMSHTYSIAKGIADCPNVATPYTNSFSDRLVQVPYDRWDNIGPAASIISNVNDLSHWLMFQLDSGRFNNKQVMPFSVLQKTRDLNIITSSRKSVLFPVHIRGYGLGVFSSDYNGRQIFWHTGGAAGMVSNVCFVPEERLGIAILTNNDNQDFFEALRYQVLDAYLGVNYKNRSQQLLPDFNEGMNAQLKEIAALKSRTIGTDPILPFVAYTGTYSNQLYGTIIITSREEQLTIKFRLHPDLTATLNYMDNDEWLLQYNNIEYGVFPTKFTITKNKVQSVSIKANDYVEFDPYVFVKK